MSESDVNSDFKWKMYTDENMRLFPKDDTIWYFSNNSSTRYMPHIFVSKEPDKKRETGQIIAPPSSLVDPLERHSIILAGYAIHHKGYYHSRRNTAFTDLICVVDGALVVKFDGKKKILHRGEALILPPRCEADNYVDCRQVRVFWAHLKNTAFWREILGDSTFTRKLENFEAISRLIDIYRDEVFSSTRSMRVLDMVAELLVTFLRREFSAGKRQVLRGRIEKLVKLMSGSLDRDWSLKRASEESGLSIKDIESACMKNYMMSFSKLTLKMRMHRAIDLLKMGLTNVEIAAKLGYATPYSFSKAFKLYYGKSPKIFMGD